MRKFDYFFPEFGDMPPQDIHNYELFADYKSSNETDDDVAFGYIGYGDEYRHHRSMAVGSFRNNSTRDFKSWVLTRDFTQHPSLNSNAFISSGKQLGALVSPQKSNADPDDPKYDSTISHDIWATGFSQNPFIVQVGINCRAVRPLPYVPDPSRIL